MTLKVCFVGDDAHPPWNHASSILAKRMIECLSNEGVSCSLATSSMLDGENWNHEPTKGIYLAKTSGRQSLDAIRLSLASRAGDADVHHLIGTNALVYSPVSKLLRTGAKIIRHIFTPYDAKDRMISPLRRIANRLFIDSYAFTSPWTGRWRDELPSNGTRRFLLRPPINCEFYRPSDEKPYATIEPLVLYMGPLLPTRFPGKIVLPAVKNLEKRGVKIRLVVLTTASRTSIKACEELLSLGRTLGLSDSLDVRRINLSEDERIRWYNSADVVVFPYVGPDPEKLADPPFGILEAMSCGRVVLATDVLSVPEVIEDGVNGFLMHEISIAALQAGLDRAIQARDEAKTRARARERILERFDYPRVADATIKAYTRMIG